MGKGILPNAGNPTCFRTSGLAALLGVGLMLPGLVTGQVAERGDIVGQVVARADGRPLAGVQVRFLELLLSTDTAGVFRIEQVPADRYRLRLWRDGYDSLSVSVAVAAGGVSRLRLVLAETVIPLPALNADALSRDSMQARSAGYARSLLTREDLRQWEESALTFGDVLRTEIPSVRMRRLERLAGSEVCIELRSVRSAGNRCLMPAIYLDGVPITNPTHFLAALEVRSVQSVEIVPAAEAGVRFGSGALYGAIVIESRRAGVTEARTPANQARPFDWSMDRAGHDTPTVAATALLSNLAGAALGYGAARSCIELRQPARDALQSSCTLLPTIASGLAAVVMPSLGGALGVRLAGQTPSSRGKFLPAAIGSAMLIVPGYALVVSGQLNDSETMRWTGTLLVTVGAPLAATVSDFLFRSTR